MRTNALLSPHADLRSTPAIRAPTRREPRRLDVDLDLYNVFNDKMRPVWGAYDRPRTVLDRNDPQIHFGINGRL